MILLSRAAVVTVAIAAGAGVAAAADVVRESTGQRRAMLDEMELQPAPAEVWSALQDWTNGGPHDAASTAGSPVLILTWSSFQPTSRPAMSVAQRMAEQFGPRGLIVIGAHAPQGWDGAAAMAASVKATFPIARDEGGALRRALHSDQDPDFYLIDRAGNLRYADIATQSVGEAVRELVEESREAAADVPKIRAERAAEAAAALRRTGGIRTEIDLSTLPEIPFPEPDPSAYKNLSWPKMSDETKNALGLRDRDRRRGEPEPEYRLSFSPQLWYPREPTATKGRAYVIYPWHPDLRASYSIMGQMDLLQEQHQRDLIVIGALVAFRNLDNNSRRTDEEDPEELREKYQAFLKNRRYSHYLAADPSGSALSWLEGRGSRGFPLPGAIVVSSDGVVRWAGRTTEPGFRAAIDRVLAIDPGIQARRKAEREFIANRK